MRRLLLIFVILALLVLIPFVVFGDQLESVMSLENTTDRLREFGAWAWAAGIGLLVIDLFLPILGTVVMSALGLIYGWFLGGVLASLGSMAAGLLAYGLCRGAGRGIAEKIAGKQGLERGEELFSGDVGGWMVALSRWMPVLPEVIACMAGLTAMPVRKFCAALACGSLPLGFTFAWIGSAGVSKPWLAIALSAGLPPLIWLILGPFFSKPGQSEPKPASKIDPDPKAG